MLAQSLMQGECRGEAERGLEKGAERPSRQGSDGGHEDGACWVGRRKGTTRQRRAEGRRIASRNFPERLLVGELPRGTSALGIYARFRPRFRRRVLIGEMGGKGGPAVSNKNLNG